LHALAEDICSVKALVIDSKTRWNSTADMIQRALDMQRPLQLLVDEDVELEEYRLEHLEWRLLEKMLKLLDVSMNAVSHHQFNRKKYRFLNLYRLTALEAIIQPWERLSPCIILSWTNWKSSRALLQNSPTPPKYVSTN